MTIELTATELKIIKVSLSALSGLIKDSSLINELRQKIDSQLRAVDKAPADKHLSIFIDG